MMGRWEKHGLNGLCARPTEWKTSCDRWVYMGGWRGSNSGSSNLVKEYREARTVDGRSAYSNGSPTVVSEESGDLARDGLTSGARNLQISVDVLKKSIAFMLI